MYLAPLHGAISHLWTDQIRIQFFTLWVSSFILFPRSLWLNDHLPKILNSSQTWIELEPMTARLCFSLPCLWAFRRSQWGPINCKRSFYPVRIELRVCYRIYMNSWWSPINLLSACFSSTETSRDELLGMNLGWDVAGSNLTRWPRINRRSAVVNRLPSCSWDF